MIDRIDIYLYTYLEINKSDLVACSMSFYEAGTTNLKDSYISSRGNICHPNPVIADAYGRFPKIFINKPYKVVLRDENGKWIFEDNYELEPTD